jgi:hypothetical protein
LPVSSAICASSACCACGFSVVFCVQLVTGLPVDGSMPAADCHDWLPHGVLMLGRLATSERVCACWFDAAVCSASLV